ncbi:MAG: AAA family ATPase [Myxococcota bacterium]|nr:AAA family ATPase [Myxococcota bacterium]
MVIKETEDSKLNQLLIAAADEPRWLAPNTTLYKQRFIIKALLGSGGMGVLYEALDTKHNTTVALKTLLAVNSSAIYRLKQEFRALADLTHPNLVGLHELFFDEDLNQWFFTMDLVPGDTLFERLGASPEESLVRSLFCQLARGIQAIHDKGKLHRDLKPSNAIVTPDGRVVILDFGLVSDQQEGGVGQTVLGDSSSGTPLYMSPEQCGGEPASIASDWYAFGTMLFEALTGMAPFAGPDCKITMQKQMEDPPQPGDLRSVDPRKDIAEDLASLTWRLLSRDPEKRPGFEEIIVVLDTQRRTSERWGNFGQGVFIGREHELATVKAAFEGTDAGYPAIVLVEGTSGIGKTAFVERFLSTLQSQSKAVILTGRCFERESVPYKACDSIIDALSHFLHKISPSRAASLMPRHIHALARIFPVFRRLKVVREIKLRRPLPADPVELRRLGFSALKELLLRIAEQEPLVLFVDDLHWIDKDSAELLSAIVSFPDPPPLLLIGAYRNDEISNNPGLSSLHNHLGGQRELDLTVIHLGPLNADECHTLTHNLLSRGFFNQIDAIARESRGNPFFLVEMSRHAAAAQVWGTKLDDLITHRVSSLPDAQRDLLEAVCISARPIDQDLLNSLLPKQDTARCIRELLTQNLIRYKSDSSSKLTCYHDQIRVVVIAALHESRSQLWHTRFFEAMEQQAAPDLTALIEHYLAAKAYSKAGACAVDAGAQAEETLAFGKAAELYRIAVDHANVDEKGRIELRIKLAQSLANSMRNAEAGREYLQISQVAGQLERGALRQKGAEQLLFSGRTLEGLAVLKEAFEENGLDFQALQQKNPFASLMALDAMGYQYTLRSEIDPAELRRLDIMWAAGLGTYQLKDDASMVFLTAHAQKALEVGEPLHLARALAMMSKYNFCFGMEAPPSFTQLKKLSAEIPNPIIAAWLDMAAANQAFWFCRFKESIEIFKRAEAFLLQECSGIARELSAARVIAALAYSYLYEMDAIWSTCTRWLGEAQENENIHLSASFTAMLTPRWIVADKPDNAVRELEALLSRLSKEANIITRLNGEMFLALSKSYMGDVAAWDRLNATVTAFDSTVYRASPMLTCTYHWHRGHAAIALASKHPQPEALLHCAEQDAHIVETPIAVDGSPLDIDYWQSLGMLLRAGIAAAKGDTPLSRRLIDASLDIMARDKNKNRLFEASARYRQAQLMGGREGEEQQAISIAALRNMGVNNPSRWNDYAAPGFNKLS